MIGKFSHTKLDHSRVEIKGSSKDERKETKKNSNKVCPESDCKSSMQSPTSSVLSDKNLAVSTENTYIYSYILENQPFCQHYFSLHRKVTLMFYIHRH